METKSIYLLYVYHVNETDLSFFHSENTITFLPIKSNISVLVLFHDCTARFMSYLVKSPKAKLCHDLSRSNVFPKGDLSNLTDHPTVSITCVVWTYCLFILFSIFSVYSIFWISK